jgi:hypothetical protein
VTPSDANRWARRVRSERPAAALDEYLAGFEAFFNDYAGRVDYWRARNPGYHESIASLARFYVPRGASVLGVGCGPGFFKECAPSIVATDVVPKLSVDVRCAVVVLPLHLVRAEPFVDLPYLATFGFKVGSPLPGLVQTLARSGEAALRQLARWMATRIFIVLEKAA